MKRILTFFILFLIAGSVTALGYSLYQVGIIGQKSQIKQETAQTDVTSTSTASETGTKDLSWLKDIKGVSEDDAKKITATTTAIETTNTTTTTDVTTSTTATTDESEDNTDTEQVIQDLGKADALTSTIYDYSFKALALSVELRHGTVFLSWTPATNDTFVNYKVIRSSADENPYLPKTPSLKTLNDVTETAYTDSKALTGKTYYYRICMTKEGKPPACGNIIKVNL